MLKALSTARAEAASGPGETLPGGCAGHVTTHGRPTGPGAHEFPEIPEVPRDHLPTHPARGVFGGRPRHPVKWRIPPGQRARQQPLWAWQAHLSAHLRWQQATSLLPSRRRQLDTTHPPGRGRHFPGSGQAGGCAPSAPGPRPEGGHGNPSTGSNRVSETQDKGPCDGVVPSLIQVKGAILSSLGNSDKFCPMEVSGLRKEHFECAQRHHLSLPKCTGAGADSGGHGVWFPDGHPSSEAQDRPGWGVLGNGPHSSYHRRRDGLIPGKCKDLGGYQLKERHKVSKLGSS